MKFNQATKENMIDPNVNKRLNQASPAALLMTGRANGAWRSLMQFHSGKGWLSATG